MVPAELLDRSDTAELRHVQVDDHCVRVELLGEPNSLEPVVSDADEGQLGLLLDQPPERGRIVFVVVSQQHTDCRIRLQMTTSTASLPPRIPR